MQPDSSNTGGISDSAISGEVQNHQFANPGMPQPQTQYINPQQAVYASPQQVAYMPNGQMVIIGQPQQNGLIYGSYICSVVGFFLAGIIFGPIGFVLGMLAKNNGDPRGNSAMIVGGIVTGLSIVMLGLLIALEGI
tara:strand:+ start:3854 stop:4261 length:408 start_codon:yes stop_codon:yes gene_type:complete